MYDFFFKLDYPNRHHPRYRAGEPREEPAQVRHRRLRRHFRQAVAAVLQVPQHRRSHADEEETRRERDEEKIVLNDQIIKLMFTININCFYLLT